MSPPCELEPDYDRVRSGALRSEQLVRPGRVCAFSHA